MTDDMVALKRAKRRVPADVPSPSTQIRACREAGQKPRTRDETNEPLILQAARSNTLAAVEIVKRNAEAKAAAVQDAAEVAAAAAAAEAAAEAMLDLPAPDLVVTETSQLEHESIVRMLRESPHGVFASNPTGVAKIDIRVEDLEVVAEHVIDEYLMKPIAVGTFNKCASPELGYHLPGHLFELQKHPIVVRVTRTDAMEKEKDDDEDEDEDGQARTPFWRADQLRPTLAEVAWALLAARVGFGPRVHAAAVYPFPKKAGLYSCILIMKQFKGNLNESFFRLVGKYPKLEKGRLAYCGRLQVHALVSSLSNHWSELAKRRVIAFDAKMGNVVANDIVTRLIDYQPEHFYRTHTSPRVCWFVNCLLTLTHVKSWAPSLVSDEVNAMCAPHLARIIDEIETEGNNNETWILQVATHRPDLGFQPDTLFSLVGDEKLMLHLQCMVAAYFTTKKSSASKWKGWEKGYKDKEPLIITLFAYLKLSSTIRLQAVWGVRIRGGAS